MKTYEVIIQRHVVYMVNAENEIDAQDAAWDIYSSDDLSDPLIAEVSEMQSEGVSV